MHLTILVEKCRYAYCQHAGLRYRENLSALTSPPNHVIRLNEPSQNLLANMLMYLYCCKCCIENSEFFGTVRDWFV